MAMNTGPSRVRPKRGTSRYQRVSGAKFKRAEVRKMTIDELLRSGNVMRKRYGITQRELAAIFKNRHDLGKLKDILAPIAGAVSAAALLKIQKKLLSKRPKVIPFERVGLRFLERISTPTERSNPTASPVAMEEMAAPSIARMGEGGQLFLRRTHINPGVRNRMLKSAIDDFSIGNSKYYTTGANLNLDCQYSQAGINRKGIYAPLPGTLKSDFLDADVANDSRGTVVKAMRRNFCYTYAMTDEVEGYMDGAQAGNLDLLFPLVGTTSVHKIRNRMVYTPIDVTIMILRCREVTDRHPAGSIWNDWDPTGPATSSYYAPRGDDDNPYVWPTQQATIIQKDYQGNDVSKIFNIETSCQLGVTPQFSPTFNRLWQVCNVMKQRLEPNDILEYHFTQEFQQCHSLNDFIANYGPTLTAAPDLNRYSCGDYELLIMFAGIPGTCVGNVADTTLSVDALKSRISKTVSHNIRYAWPTLIKGDYTQSSKPEELFQRGWITTKEKTAFTNRRTDYFANGYSATITTDASEETGGGI